MWGGGLDVKKSCESFLGKGVVCGGDQNERGMVVSFVVRAVEPSVGTKKLRKKIKTAGCKKRN